MDCHLLLQALDPSLSIEQWLHLPLYALVNVHLCKSPDPVFSARDKQALLPAALPISFLYSIIQRYRKSCKSGFCAYINMDVDKEGTGALTIGFNGVVMGEVVNFGKATSSQEGIDDRLGRND